MIRLAGLLALLAPAAAAQGFATDDLTALPDPAPMLGPTYVSRAEPARLTLMCTGCADLVAVDILLGRQDDGTEGRVRSGETTAGELEAQCRARDPSCRIELLDVAPAVGWISAYEGVATGSTAVILRDGDLLTVRSIAGDAATARANADAIVRGLAPAIIGE